jgi:hypothetical protein
VFLLRVCFIVVVVVLPLSASSLLRRSYTHLHFCRLFHFPTATYRHFSFSLVSQSKAGGERETKKQCEMENAREENERQGGLRTKRRTEGTTGGLVVRVSELASWARRKAR